MKGVVFTEFMEFVEQRYSPETADDIVEACVLSTGGAYTAVGTYPPEEILRLVQALSIHSGSSTSDLFRDFGAHLFTRLVSAYPPFLEVADSAFGFLVSIESHIHVEVKKLDPDAQMPHFECRCPQTDRMELVYRSQRPLADLAEGLITGCCVHFGENIAVAREDLPGERGTAARFLLTRRD